MNKFKDILYIVFGFLLAFALVCLVVFISKNSKLAENEPSDSQVSIDLPTDEETPEEITEDTVEIIEPDNTSKIQPDTSSDVDPKMDSDHKDKNPIDPSTGNGSNQEVIYTPGEDLTEDNNSDEDVTKSDDSDDPIDNTKETNISISPNEELYKQCLTRVEYSQDPSSNYNIHKSISTIDIDQRDFMTTYLYFKEINHINGDLYLRFQYFSDQWVFTESINIFVDNKLVYDFNVNYNPKANIAFTSGVSERITLKTDQEFHDLIENVIWYSDDVSVEFVGENSSYTYSLQPTEIQSIRDVYIVWSY